jgi:hypothetical protein
MKTIVFDKQTARPRNFRRISLTQSAQEDEYVSTVKKSFSYKVSLTDAISPNVPRPEVEIRKEFDTKKRMEKFHFKVKGYFFKVHERIVAKVYFEHHLVVEIIWKKNFSPNKSVVLTE